jgi:GMP synthase-like glutamine amidotransferase
MEPFFYPLLKDTSVMNQPLHIGLLLCHTFEPVLKQVGGLDYPEIFRQQFLAIDEHIQFTDFNAYLEELPHSVDQCDVWLINGSPAGVYDDSPWIHQLSDFIERLNAAKKPTFGICFGHQLMAQVLGGKVALSNKGWGLGISHNQVVAHEEYMQPQAETIDIMVFHQDQVTQLPTGAKVLASNDFCPNYMVQYNDHMLSIQGHPEFNAQMIEGILGGKSFDDRPAIRAQGLANSAGTPDTALLFQWIINFYQQTLIQTKPA